MMHNDLNGLQDEVKREPAWAVCAVALPRESYYWLRDWVDHHLCAGASLVVIYDNTGSTGSQRKDSAFLSGRLQREQRSKRGEEYGRLTAHLGDEQIQEEWRSISDSYGGKVKIIPWQPKNEAGRVVHGQVEAYEDFILRYRDAVGWCAFIDMDEYVYCRPGLSVGRVLFQVEQDWPRISMFRMKGWRFECRWSGEGPKDISRHRRHLPMKEGGEKNFIRLRDVVKADIHWYWKLKPGFGQVTARPEDFAFCHYNVIPKELEKSGKEFILPRAFLKTEVDEKAKVRIR